MILTPNYNLKKIQLDDSPPDITVQDDNWDIIDTQLKNAADHEDDTTIHVTATDKSNWNSKAAADHTHAASDINSGTLSVNRGGTGKTSWRSGRIIYASSSTALSQITNASGALYTTGSSATPKFGVLPVAQGGTGETTYCTDYSLTLSATSYITSSNFNGFVRYFPYLEMCYLRAQFYVTQSVPAGDFNLCRISSTIPRPNNTQPLCVYSQSAGPTVATVLSTGYVNVYTGNTLSANSHTRYVWGWYPV